MLEESERDATIVGQALQVVSFDKAAVTEVICCRTPSELRNLKRAYFSKYSSQLLQEITSSNLRFNGNHKEVPPPPPPPPTPNYFRFIKLL